MLPPCATGRRNVSCPSQRGPVSGWQMDVPSMSGRQTQSVRHSPSTVHVVLHALPETSQRKPPQSFVCSVFVPLESHGYVVSSLGASFFPSTHAASLSTFV